MNATKITGTIVLVIGIAVVIVSATADITGLGKYAGFGYLQIAGAVAGVVIALVGLLVLLKKPKAVANA